MIHELFTLRLIIKGCKIIKKSIVKFYQHIINYFFSTLIDYTCKLVFQARWYLNYIKIKCIYY